MGLVTWTTLHFLRPILGPHCNPSKDNLKLSYFESSTFFSVCSPCGACLRACGFNYTPLWIQGLKRLVVWIQTLTLLEEQGLWIQASILHCSCTKAMSGYQHLHVIFKRLLRNNISNDGRKYMPQSILPLAL